MNLSNDCGQTKTAWDIICFGLDTHMGDMSVDFKSYPPPWLFLIGQYQQMYQFRL